MIDYHTHILPGMDDGSRGTSESIEMLLMSRRQGISKIIATPHFYAGENKPEQFLQRRLAAWNRLERCLTDDMPEILLGAEVSYFEGISRTDATLLLRTEGTSLLLLEMPFVSWSSRVIQDVLQLNENPFVQVILAHIERYLPMQRREVLDQLLNQGVLFQANASFFLRWPQRRRAMQMLREGQIHLLGSDCHNLDTRPPCLGNATEMIRRKLGQELVNGLEQNMIQLLERRPW